MSTNSARVKHRVFPASSQPIPEFRALMTTCAAVSVCTLFMLSAASQFSLRSSGLELSLQFGEKTLQSNGLDYLQCTNEQLSRIYMPSRFARYFCSSHASSPGERSSLLGGEGSGPGMSCQKIPSTSLPESYRGELVRSGFFIVLLVDTSYSFTLKYANFLGTALICGHQPIPPPGTFPSPSPSHGVGIGELIFYHCCCCRVHCPRGLQKCRCKFCCGPPNC